MKQGLKGFVPRHLWNYHYHILIYIYNILPSITCELLLQNREPDVFGENVIDRRHHAIAGSSAGPKLGGDGAQKVSKCYDFVCFSMS